MALLRIYFLLLNINIRLTRKLSTDKNKNKTGSEATPKLGQPDRREIFYILINLESRDP